MRTNYELYDGQGSLIEQKEIEVPDVDYRQARRAELQPLDGEGMDAMRKALLALAAGQPVPQEFTDYAAKVDEIKAKYPKEKKNEKSA